MKNLEIITKALKELGIDYLKIDHPAMEGMDEYANIEKDYGIVIPKNLLLCNRQQTNFYLLAMPGDKPFKTKELSSQIQSARLSFASSEQLDCFLHCYHGSTSIFGLFFDKEQKVKLLIDQDLLNMEKLGFHPCDNHYTLVVKTKDILEKFIPFVGHDPSIVKLTGE